MPALTTEEAAAATDRLSAELARRRPEVALFDRYYRGEQPLRFASPEWGKQHQNRYKGFSDNWCGVVGNAPAERLRPIGFRVDLDGDMSELERRFQQDWVRNDMDAQSSAGFLQSIIARRSYVLVWGDDDDLPVYTWETPDQAIVEYDPANPRRRRLGLKTWRDDITEYATLYAVDAVWKWQRPAGSMSGLILPETVGLVGGWQPRDIADEPWPIPNPLGRVPLVEVPNRPMLKGPAMSDIAGTMAMQDAINLLWAYLFGAADFASMPARVIMGQGPPKIPILDSNGQKIGEQEVSPEDLRNGRLLWLSGQNTSISQWESAKLDVFTQVIDVAVAHIAAQTRTPAHYLINTGSAANAPAESFTAAETGLVKKCESFQLFSNAPLREIHALGALVRGDEAGAALADQGITMWKDAETHSTSQLADALTKKKELGFPFEWIAEQAGLSQPEVSRVLAMRQREIDAGLASAVADALRADTAPLS